MTYTIRQVRNPLAFITAIIAVLALVGSTAASAAKLSPTAAAASSIKYCTSPCRMIYPGGGVKQPDGPAGPLTSAWTLNNNPETITVSNGWTLNEIANYNPKGGCDGFPSNCGEWRYNASSMELVNYHWDITNKVLTNAIMPIANDNSGWIKLPGGGYAAKCLQWSYDNDVYVIGLNVNNYTWSFMSGGETECNALPGVLPS